MLFSPAQNRYWLLKEGLIPRPLIKSGLTLLESENVFLHILLTLWTTPLAGTASALLGAGLRQAIEGFNLQEADAGFKTLSGLYDNSSDLQQAAAWQVKTCHLELQSGLAANEHLLADFFTRARFGLPAAQLRPEDEQKEANKRDKSGRVIRPTILPAALAAAFFDGLQCEYTRRLQVQPSSHCSISWRTGPTGRVSFTISGLDATALFHEQPIRLLIPYGLPGVFGRGWEVPFMLQLCHSLGGDCLIIRTGLDSAALRMRFTPLPKAV